MDKKSRPSIFKRGLALMIDLLILGVIGYMSGAFLESFYVSLGNYGSLIGATITLIYFSIFHSSIVKGQTVGKQIVAIRVTNLTGEYLSLKKAFLRSFVFYFPIMIVGIFFEGNGILILGSLPSLYFALVNKKSRRSLHDILALSIVVNEATTDFKVDEQNDRSNKKIIPIALITFLIIGLGIYQIGATNTPDNNSPEYLNPLLSATEKIENKKGWVVNEFVFSTSTYRSTNSPPRTTSHLMLTVRIDDKNELNVDSKYFEEFYEIIKKEVPEYQETDGVVITFDYGYNIGIASSTESVTRTFKNKETN
jgi:uncharacterized RDD family membrane protein YckC